MNESAVTGLRERKKQRTSAELTAVCRRLTAEHGLAGFTIEEACAEVDVSRRTFFNYFASKEDAVLGADPDDDARRFAADFLARGSSGWPGVIDDIVELVIEHFESSGGGVAAHGAFMRALEREPQLLVRFVGLSRERDRMAAALVSEREGVPLGDPRAQAVVSILGTLLHTTAERLLAPDATDDFATILTNSLAAHRAVLAEPTPRKGD